MTLCLSLSSRLSLFRNIFSVLGFINEVQALHQPGQDPKCQVTWARFETTDINDPSLYCDGADMTGGVMPLLLVLGYNNGLQIWLIPASGEAKLVMSRFHGQVRLDVRLQTWRV